MHSRQGALSHRPSITILTCSERAPAKKSLSEEGWQEVLITRPELKSNDIVVRLSRRSRVRLRQAEVHILLCFLLLFRIISCRLSYG